MSCANTDTKTSVGVGLGIRGAAGSGGGGGGGGGAAAAAAAAAAAGRRCCGARGNRVHGSGGSTRFVFGISVLFFQSFVVVFVVLHIVDVFLSLSRCTTPIPYTVQY